MSDEKKAIFLIGGLILTIVVIYFAFGRNTGPSPASITANRLSALEDAVTAWAKTHGSAPEKLEALGLEAEALQDHIGNPFIYEVNGSQVKITSYGADSKPGGVMFKADRIVTINLPEK